jgi:hypothetical protein
MSLRSFRNETCFFNIAWQTALRYMPKRCIISRSVANRDPFQAHAPKPSAEKVPMRNRVKTIRDKSIRLSRGTLRGGCLIRDPFDIITICFGGGLS